MDIKKIHSFLCCVLLWSVNEESYRKTKPYSYKILLLLLLFFHSILFFFLINARSSISHRWYIPMIHFVVVATISNAMQKPSNIFNNILFECICIAKISCQLFKFKFPVDHFFTHSVPSTQFFFFSVAVVFLFIFLFHSILVRCVCVYFLFCIHFRLVLVAICHRRHHHRL